MQSPPHQYAQPAFASSGRYFVHKVLIGISYDSRYLLAVNIRSQALVNSMTILVPNRVILFGSMFRDGMIRQKLDAACCEYDPRCGAERILYSALADQEGFPGPAAVFVQSIF